jgi:hypothetical protein
VVEWYWEGSRVGRRNRISVGGEGGGGDKRMFFGGLWGYGVGEGYFDVLYGCGWVFMGIGVRVVV